MTTTKIQLAKKLKGAGLSYRQALICLDILINAITEALAKGETIHLRGFGTLYVTKWAARKTGLNGHMAVPKHGKVLFRPCEHLREAVWNLGEDN